MGSSLEATANDTLVLHLSYRTSASNKPVLGTKLHHCAGFWHEHHEQSYVMLGVQQHGMLCGEWNVGVTESNCTSSDSRFILEKIELLVPALELQVPLKRSFESFSQ